jgi:NAD-dependent dihydropyrimidine dehydrogenase PreA subunit
VMLAHLLVKTASTILIIACSVKGTHFYSIHLTPSSKYFYNTQCVSSCPAGSIETTNSTNKVVFKQGTLQNQPVSQIAPNSVLTIEKICCTENCKECRTFETTNLFKFTQTLSTIGKIYFNQCEICNDGFYLVSNTDSKSSLWSTELTPTGTL